MNRVFFVLTEDIQRILSRYGKTKTTNAFTLGKFEVSLKTLKAASAITAPASTNKQNTTSKGLPCLLWILTPTRGVNKFGMQTSSNFPQFSRKKPCNEW